MSPEQRARLTVQFILTATFLALCTSSIFGLIKEETSLAFSKQKSAYFPSITVCPLTYDLKGIESFDTISPIAIGDYLHVHYENYIKQSSYEIAKRSEVFSTLIHPLILHNQLLIRNCTTINTLDLNDSAIQPGKSGFLFYLELLPNSYFKDFMLIFHEKNEINLDPTTDEGDTYFVNYKNKSTNFVDLHMKRYIDLNSYDNPCDEMTGENSVQKLNRMYHKNMDCSLPWLVGDSKYQKRPCQSQQDFNEFRKWTAILSLNQINTHKCHRNIWKYKVKYTRFDKESVNGTEIGLFMPSNEVEIIQQVRLYTMTNFIADFGGYLGLLLGVSMMSLFDMILKSIRILRQKHQTDVDT